MSSLFFLVSAIINALKKPKTLFLHRHASEVKEMPADRHYLAEEGDGTTYIRSPHMGVAKRFKECHAEDGEEQHKDNVITELVASPADCP